MKKPSKKVVLILIAIILTWITLTFCGIIPSFNKKKKCVKKVHIEREEPTRILKPVIYLYPTEKTDVKIQLDYQGKIIADYPTYDPLIKGWEVIAYPDGHLINKADNKEYSYLFWEGTPTNKIKWDLSTGFVVKGSEVREFLQKTLSKMGLTPKEYNEFIVFWYPLMKDNPYNLIHFSGEQYLRSAPLKITPIPNSMLRVFMVYKPLTEKMEIKEQEIGQFERKGFSVIEWGGTIIK